MTESTFTGLGQSESGSESAGDDNGAESQSGSSETADADAGDGDGADADADAGDGDGDGESGDGDSGDGDSGDGDSGDGDSGDGDSGDGDSGDGDSGDGDSGDGDSGDGDGDGDPCAGVTECGAIDDAQCADNLTLETCVEDLMGCLVWEQTDCSVTVSNGICDGIASECVDACINIVDPCASAGDTECNGDTLRTCTDAGGCLVWVDTDCTAAEADGGCNDGGTAMCLACENEPCAPGDTQCSDALTLEECIAGADTCGDWQTTDCSELEGGLGTCDDSQADALCDDPCEGVTDACTTQNEERCAGADDEFIQECLPDGGQGGCLVWQDVTDCTGTLSPGLNDLFAECQVDTPAYSCLVPDGCIDESPTPTFDPPQIMLVLDKSGSMMTTYDHDNSGSTADVTRWAALHQALTSILDEFEERINFGVKVFPTNTGCDVSPGVELGCGPLQRDEVLAAIPIEGATVSGLTPSGTALTEAITYLENLNSGGPPAIIFMADGGTYSSCGEPDTAAEIEPVLSTAYNGGDDPTIPTYVIGINSTDGPTDWELNGFANAGGKPTGPYTPPTIIVEEDFEGLGGLPGGWTTGGDANWFLDTTFAASGSNSIGSGNIGDNGESWVEHTFTMAQAGTYYFTTYIDSEPGFDGLLIRDTVGATVTNYSLISDVTTWTGIWFPVSAGTHTVRMTYDKDFITSTVVDAMWIDDVSVRYGGSGSAYYDAQNTAELEVAMEEIISSVIVCEIDLGLAPPDGDEVSVKVEGVQYARLDPSVPAFDCDSTDGWYYTQEPSTTCESDVPFTCDEITLCGAACTTFKGLETPTADVVFYCDAG